MISYARTSFFLNRLTELLTLAVIGLFCSAVSLLAGTPQTISFPAIEDRQSTDAPFALSATSSSGLAVSYSIVSPGGVAAVAGSTVTLSGTPGSVTVKASQAGDATYDGAADVVRTFAVGAASQRFVKVAVSTSYSQGAGIRADGTLWTWGLNTYGQLGQGDYLPRAVATQVGADSNWSAVACGWTHMLALRTNGTLWAWGNNVNGQLGTNNNNASTTPVQVGTSTAWAALACGQSHTVATRTDGTLWAWGFNRSGQVGNNSTSDRNFPTQIGTATWTSVACGNEHTLAVRADGTLWSWGYNNNYQLGFNHITSLLQPTQVGTGTTWTRAACGFAHSAALQADGTLWAWGFASFGQTGVDTGGGSLINRIMPGQVGTATDWTAVACGSQHTLGIRSGGTLWAWGSNSNGQIGDGTVTNQPLPVQIGSATGWTSVVGGNASTLAGRADGSQWVWGSSSDGQLGDGETSPRGSPTQVGSFHDWTLASGGETHTMAIRTTGGLYGWGGNSEDQLGGGPRPGRATQTLVDGTAWSKVSAGPTHTLGVRADGTLWAWGNNSEGQLGDGTTTNRPNPVQIGTGTNWISVACGFRHTVALRGNGTLWGWGSNSVGQLGDGTSTQRNSPVQIGSSTWDMIACGSHHVLARKTDGTLWAWGFNSWGQAGNGTTTHLFVPTQIGAASWLSLDCGSHFSAGVRADGTLWAWGTNNHSQLGDGTTTQRNSPVQVGTATNWAKVACGKYHTLAIRADATLWCWGDNTSGQVGDGSFVQRTMPVQIGQSGNWVSLSGGDHHSLGIRTDGSLWSWGSNDRLQLGRMEGTNPARMWPVKTTQTLSFPALPALVEGQSFQLPATASSGLPVRYSATGSVTVDGRTLTPTAPGPITVLAIQEGDAAWKQAPDVMQTAQAVANAPLVAVLGNGQLIGSNDTTPASSDNTDFGSLLVGAPTSLQTRTFLIRNDGGAALTLGTVTLTGAQAADFSVTTAPVSPVAPGGSTTFQITFVPGGVGLRRGGVSFTTNDATASTFSFAIQGTGERQTIAFPPIAGHSSTDASFTVGATANSGLPVTTNLASTTEVAGYDAGTGTVNLTGMSGAVTLRARQAGDGTYPSAEDVYRSFVVTQPGQRFVHLAQATYCKHGAAIRADGTLWAWGLNDQGQLGIGNTVNQLVPVQVGTATNWASAVCNDGRTHAIRTDGTLWTWGGFQTTPLQLGSSTGWSRLVAGSDHVLALSTDGTLWSWGGNNAGQLGLGHTDYQTTPVQVGSSTWTSIGAGHAHSHGVRADGTLWSWGINYNGALGLGDTVNRTTPTQVGNSTQWATAVCGGLGFSMALRTDGTLWTWGGNDDGVLGDGGGGRTTPAQMGTATWDRVSCGGSHVLARRTDGTLWSWGNSSYGQLGLAVSMTNNKQTTPLQVGSETTWEAVSAVEYQSFALSGDGSLWTWGREADGQIGNGFTYRQRDPAQFGGAAWISASAGAYHMAAVRADGTLWTWGANRYGQVGPYYSQARGGPAQIGTDTDWAAVACGREFTLARRRDGTLWIWGRTFFGQPYETLARPTPAQVGTDSDWTAIACGDEFCLALRSNGTLWAWGSSSWGQLGIGPHASAATPTQVGTATNWTAIDCGGTHSVGLRGDGTLWTWGRNVFGQLGIGTQGGAADVPRQVGTGTYWASAACGNSCTYGVRTDGTLWSWGSNAYGQLGTGPDSPGTQLSPAQVGSAANWASVTGATGELDLFTQVIESSFTLAVRTDGSLWGWGRNNYGQASQPSSGAGIYAPVRMGTSSDWAAGTAAAGMEFGAARHKDGSLWLWGSDYNGQLGAIPSNATPARVWPQRVPQVLTFAPVHSVAPGQPLALPVTTTSGLPITCFVVSGPATISGNVLTSTGSGPVAVTVYQAGDESWLPAGPYLQTLNSGPPAVEISVAGNGVDISSADSTPSLDDHTDFGPRIPHTGAVTRTYTVINRGVLDLTLGGITFSGPHAGDFAVVAAPAASVPHAGSTTFQISFTPGGLGLRTAMLSLATNDADESPFTFAVRGSGQAESILFPAVADQLVTDGPLTLNATASNGLPVSYTLVSGPGVATLGGGTLTLTGTPGAVTIRASQAGDAMHAAAEDAYRTFVVWDGQRRFVTVAGSPLSRHAAGICSDGTLWIWGEVHDGVQEDGSPAKTKIPAPVQVVQSGSTLGWTAVSCGEDHTLAVRADGTLWAWGLNEQGQLGDGTLGSRVTPTQVGTATHWASVTAGKQRSFAIRTDGTLWAWGSNVVTTYVFSYTWPDGFQLVEVNLLGMLGTDDTTSPYRSAPVQVGTATNWASTSSGLAPTLGIRTDGTLWKWGHESTGLFDMGGTVIPAPVQVGTDSNWAAAASNQSFAHNSVGLRTDGTLWKWGWDGSSMQVGTHADWVAVAAGSSHFLARRADGTLWSWGDNYTGQLGYGTLGPQSETPMQVGTATNWTVVAGCAESSLAVQADGSLWSWGDNDHAELGNGILAPLTRPMQVGSSSRWTQVAAGQAHTLALRSDGTIWSWGNNGLGQLGDGSQTSRPLPAQVGASASWTAVAARGDSNAALRGDGTLWTWGSNNGHLGHGSLSPIVPTQVGSATNWAQVAIGVSQMLAVRADGTLWAWGGNAAGQLGLGNTLSQNTPAQVGTGTDWVCVAAGSSHSMALRGDGTLWSCGTNSDGQHGNGTTVGHSSFVQCGTRADWVSVTCGNSHTAALDADGRLWVWGDNSYGQMGDGTTADRLTPGELSPGRRWLHVHSGLYHSAAVSDDHTLWTWGYNNEGQLGDGSTISGLLAQVGTAARWQVASAGAYHTDALLTDGTLWAWGSNFNGQLGLQDTSRPGRIHPTRVPQTLSFTPPTALVPGQPVTLAATSTSGLPIVYGVSGPASLSGSVLTATAPGLVSISVYQNGDSSWLAAEPQWHTIVAAYPAPEVELSGNGVPIANNDSTPALADHSDFGSAMTGTAPGSVMRTFTVANTGTLPLTLGSLSLGGTHAAEFSLTTPPAASVAPGASTTFQLTFVPSARGLRSASVSLPTNDADEDPLTFAIQGVGILTRQDWRQQNFGTTANTGMAADTEDADHDGLANLIEYAFGLSPIAGASQQLPAPQRTADAFTVTFTEPAGVTGVTYGASHSTSLQGGSWTPIPDTGSGTTHVFSAPVSAGDTKVFIQLSVTATP